MITRAFFRELKRRKVYRVAITYAIVGWLLIQIATQVFRITALQASLSPREKSNLKKHPKKDLVAYELYLRARELFQWAGTGDSADNGAEALRLLDGAIARDPQFALAYALASRLHSELFWFGYDKSASRLKLAKAAADTALQLQPDEGEGTSHSVSITITASEITTLPAGKLPTPMPQLRTIRWR